MIALYYAIWILWAFGSLFCVYAGTRINFWIMLTELFSATLATYSLATGNINLLVAVPIVDCVVSAFLIPALGREVMVKINFGDLIASAFVTEIVYLLFYAAIDIVGSHLPTVPV